MVTQNVIEFLESYSVEDLSARGILRGNTHLLNAVSVEPLLQLMTEAGVTRLEYPDTGWFLESSRSFKNPRSAEVTEGRLDDLEQPGNLFNFQNTTINPYYHRTQEEIPLLDALEDAERVTIRLERHLQAFLRENLVQLEPGLVAIDGGSERSIKGWRIDITARDSNGTVVIIELKADKARDSALAQLLGYMAAVAEEDSCEVRGILVAGEFTTRLKYAAKAVPNVQLKQYTFNFRFSSV